MHKKNRKVFFLVFDRKKKLHFTHDSILIEFNTSSF